MLPEKAPEQKLEGWTILELMGHRKLGGYVREETIAGCGFLRIDIPDEGEGWQATQYYPPNSIYCLTPTTESMARAVALRNRPTPIERWELPEESQRRIRFDRTNAGRDDDGENPEPF